MLPFFSCFVLKGWGGGGGRWRDLKKKQQQNKTKVTHLKQPRTLQGHNEICGYVCTNLRTAWSVSRTTCTRGVSPWCAQPRGGWGCGNTGSSSHTGRRCRASPPSESSRASLACTCRKKSFRRGCKWGPTRRGTGGSGSRPCHGSESSGAAEGCEGSGTPCYRGDKCRYAQEAPGRLRRCPTNPCRPHSRLALDLYPPLGHESCHSPRTCVLTLSLGFWLNSQNADSLDSWLRCPPDLTASLVHL